MHIINIEKGASGHFTGGFGAKVEYLDRHAVSCSANEVSADMHAQTLTNTVNCMFLTVFFMFSGVESLPVENGRARKN